MKCFKCFIVNKTTKKPYLYDSWTHPFTVVSPPEIDKGINYNYKRAIEDDEFKEDLKSGILRSLVDLVNNSKDLYMAFRGHYLNVYYKAHNVFRIEQRKRSKSYKMTFNFNYAEYTKDYKKRKEELIYLLDCKYEKLEQKNGTRRTISKEISHNDATFWQGCSKILMELIDDYCNTALEHNYFKEEYRNSPQTEKSRQQEIALANRDVENGYFVYDIEYVQGRNNRSVKDFGRFDMLAIRFEEKIPKAIVFIELKSTESAALGKKSGVKSHHTAMESYTKDERLVNVRKKDAEHIINFYKELSMACFEDALELADLKAEILFIFTDEAINYPDKLGEYIDLHGEDFKLKREEIKTK